MREIKCNKLYGGSVVTTLTTVLYIQYGWPPPDGQRIVTAYLTLPTDCISFAAHLPTYAGESRFD
jgi:hypothetical protein